MIEAPVAHQNLTAALATQLVDQALAAGATDAEVILYEGDEFEALVRKGEVERLKESGSRAAGLRVFLGARAASTSTSDLTPAGLERLVRMLVIDGVDELVIESRTANDDRRDQITILDTLHELHQPALRYEWRAKEERLLWIADGICGAVRQHLLAEDDTPLNRLQAAGNVGELIYLTEPQAPKLRKSRLPS